MNIKAFLLVIILISVSILTTFIYKNTQKPDINYYKGYRYFEKGKYGQAIKFYKKTLAIDPSHIDSLKDLGYCYQWTGKFEQAIDTFQRLLSLKPQDYKIKKSLAEAYSWKREYEKAASLYKEVIAATDDVEAKSKLGDVLSWDKEYPEALDLYGEILAEEEDVSVRLQKARVLGWARQYGESLKEYQAILDKKYSEAVELEMKAKQACWNNRVKRAIYYCKRVIEKDPENVEVMFDLAQVYSYQSMWEEALAEYKRILDISPGHFRAKEGSRKVGLISTHLSLKSGYEFFEADSSDRGADINRHTFFNRMVFPVNYNLQIQAGYSLSGRSFSDFGDVLENEGRIGVTYLRCPDWWVNGFYDFIDYNKGIDTMHTFGGDFNFRVSDIGVSRFSYEREPLKNSSVVIRDNYYSDNFKERVDLDITKRFKLGLDYLFSNYSDDNYKNEPAFDALYYLSLEPKKFSVRYRYFYRDFDDKAKEYFSPKAFSTHTLRLNWRHFLNKEEIFFGADDLYYDITYDMSVDSEDIVTHKFSAELNWDINKRLNLNIKGSAAKASAGVYKDKDIAASLKYYF